MNIKILGTGCSNCQKLEADTKQALEELKMEAVVEKVTEIQDIMKYGVMSLPVIVVDERVLCYGYVPKVEEIKTLLTDIKTSQESRKCSCGSGCC